MLSPFRLLPSSWQLRTRHCPRLLTAVHTTSAAPPAPACRATGSNTPTLAFCAAPPPAAVPHAAASSTCTEPAPPARSLPLAIRAASARPGRGPSALYPPPQTPRSSNQPPPGTAAHDGKTAGLESNLHHPPASHTAAE